MKIAVVILVVGFITSFFLTYLYFTTIKWIGEDFIVLRGDSPFPSDHESILYFGFVGVDEYHINPECVSTCEGFEISVYRCANFALESTNCESPEFVKVVTVGENLEEITLDLENHHLYKLEYRGSGYYILHTYVIPWQDGALWWILGLFSLTCILGGPFIIGKYHGKKVGPVDDSAEEEE